MVLVVLAGLMAPSSSSAAVLAKYTLDDGTATDTSGNGNDGTIIGSPTLEEGILGQSLRLGINDSITVPDSPSLGTPTPSVMIWIKLDESSTTTGARLLRKIEPGAGGYAVSLLRSGQVRFELSDGANRAAVTSAFPVALNVWTAINAAYDGTDLELYLHGQLAGQASAPGLDLSNTADINIGTRLGGNIDQIQIGDVAPGPDIACTAALKIWHGLSTSCIPSFTDIAPAEGLEDRNHRSFGATLVDIDQDGWIDLYYVNGAGNPDLVLPPSGTCPQLPDPIGFIVGSANALHMNQGDGTFGPDTAAEVGIADEWNAMRHVWADYDRDGLLDMISHNFILSTLYKQVLGDPMMFEDWNDESGTHICLGRGTGASWIDLNADGYLDLHVVEYDPTRRAVDHLNQVYMNDTFGGFTDVTDLTGLTLADNPMGQAWADFDNDGDQDLFQPNSHEVATRLYQNNGVDLGTGVPTFTDIAASAGVAVIGEPNRGIGVSWGDYNNDRRLDLLFSREADSRLWRNDGPDENGDWKFTDMSDLGGFETTDGLKFWGGGFADLDNDGWLDIVLTNRLNGDNRVLFNNGDETFREVTAALGMENRQYPNMGFVAGDRDNDGDLDVVLTSHSQPQGGDTFDGDPNFVYVNNERGNNWIQFRLTGTESNLEAVGARIEVRARLVPGAGPVWQSREINAGTGFFSDFPRTQTIGLGKAQRVDSVVIKWPSGQVQNLGALDPNQLYEITESAPAGAR